MRDQSHPFIDIGDRHVRAAHVVAVCAAATPKQSTFRVDVSLGADANGFVCNGASHPTRAAAETAARELVAEITRVTGNRFVEVGDTAQFVLADRVVSVQTGTSRNSRHDFMSVETVVFLDAAGNGKGYRAKHFGGNVPAVEMTEMEAVAAAEADRRQILAALT